ncbi:GNAT family N-acetyltransferase [Telmatocola sphagniphila]|uniref:GNAT family N-acetyltransferase n=1 Tax=Telmatocola sphagniphila TaxID=1123043 RepID=A0A8E6BB27_9BACT|nr:GNAT family N-acetyltransferase [Telmatocola sphagniphila]QVL34769.1 GNAT family N-acetyltransferase [Telmatocola sphagniphila]
MIEASIKKVDINSLPQVAEIYNQIFRPVRTVENLERRFLGRHNPLILLAEAKDRSVGFFVGYEWKPSTFYGWFYGVLPDFRRQGITSQLMEYAHRWATEQKYARFRIECFNSQRPMLHLAIELGFDVLGLRYDVDHKENLILFEKALG